ncbi:T9SS type A sorting domain-containing protein [bacterium]|nr:T9SS type A sorting domain-containing protein [bacterium]
MWLLLILLTLAQIGFAQPEWYGLWTAPYEVTEIEVCVRGDTADVVFVEAREDSTHLLLLPYDLNLTAGLSDPILFDWGTGSIYFEPIDFQTFSPQCRVGLSHKNSRGGSWGYGSYWFETELRHGSVWSDDGVPVETSSYVNFPDFASGNWTEGHSLRVNDGRIGVCYVSADIVTWDVWYTVHYQEYDSTYAPTAGGELPISGPYNEPLNRAIAFPLSGDSLLVYSDFGFNGDATMFLGPLSGVGEMQYYSHPICGDSRLLRELYVTDSGRIIAVFADNTLHQLVPVSQGQTDCLPFAELPTDWSPSWAFHPNYGFAAVHVDSTHLYLARLDTSGLLVQPTGVFFEPEFPITLADADVTIGDSGQVVIVWSEVINEWEGPHALNIGWIDWQDPLDAEHSPPALPTFLSLSAFPNPFNSSVKIEYEIARAGEIELSVFNTLGQKVETLFEGRASFGKHEATWSPSGSSGVYFVKLVSGDLQESRKILYIR